MLNFFQEKKYFIGVLIVFIAFTLLTGEKKEEDEFFFDDSEGKIEGVIEEEVIEKAELLYIHIAGNVGKPGLFQIEEGSRLNDLIIPAEIRDLEILDKYFNRAELLSDGMKIYIPFLDEIEDTSANSFLSESSGNSKKININTDQMQELMTLPGIGEAKARDIIIFREKNGKFKKIDDIINVKGIGQVTFENIKDLIKT